MVSSMNAGSLETGLVSPAEGVLDVSDVTVRFGGLTALDGVSLRAAPRQVTGIIGPNGAGKTTLLNAMCGFVRPSAGTISFGGHELTGIRPHRLAGLGIARTLQGVGLFQGLSAIENVMIGAHIHCGGSWRRRLQARPPETTRKVEAIIERAGLGAHRHAKAKHLDFGHQKLLELARALMAEPSLLLLDEPAAGVNPSLLALIVDRIAEINRRGVAVLVIEHNMDVIVKLCERVFVMAAGKLLSEGTPEAVMDDPRVIEAYLGRAAA